MKLKIKIEINMEECMKIIKNHIKQTYCIKEDKDICIVCNTEEMSYEISGPFILKEPHMEAE